MIESCFHVGIIGAGHIAEKAVRVPEQITGYEYEFLECKRCIREALLQSPRMPHMESIYIMELMDRIRSEWGVI
jgi:hypothetical protein